MNIELEDNDKEQVHNDVVEDDQNVDDDIDDDIVKVDRDNNVGDDVVKFDKDNDADVDAYTCIVEFLDYDRLDEEPI